MGAITKILRAILAADTLLAVILIPFHVLMVIGCLVAGKFAAAATITAMSIFGIIIYGRYWRRYPLRVFPKR